MLKIPTILSSSLLALIFSHAASAASSELFENRIDKLRFDLRNESMLSNRPSKIDCHFLEIVDKDPGCATAGARIYVERSLRKLNKAVSPELAEPNCINQQLSHLTMKKVLPSSKASLLSQFATIANEAAHGAQFESPSLKNLLVEDMPKIIAFLEELLLKVRV
jgi:hypothetical protein